jgi:hypothetical protein
MISRGVSRKTGLTSAKTAKGLFAVRLTPPAAVTNTWPMPDEPKLPPSPVALLTENWPACARASTTAGLPKSPATTFVRPEITMSDAVSPTWAKARTSLSKPAPAVPRRMSPCALRSIRPAGAVTAGRSTVTTMSEAEPVASRLTLPAPARTTSGPSVSASSMVPPVKSAMKPLFVTRRPVRLALTPPTVTPSMSVYEIGPSWLTSSILSTSLKVMSRSISPVALTPNAG